MRSPPSILETVLGSPWLGHPWRRRSTFLVLALVLAIFCVWPRHYVARAQLLPADTSNGLSAALGQAGGLFTLGTLIGQTQSVESQLTVSRSEAVLEDVLRKTGFSQKRGFRDPAKAAVALRHKVELSAVRGSILQIEVKDKDPVFAKAIASEYAGAIQNRLADISYHQGAEKQKVASDRLREATVRLSLAQNALNQFRTAHQLAAPSEQLGAAVTQVAALQGELRAKEVQLSAMSSFMTPQNTQYRMAQAEADSLRRQVESSEQASRGVLDQPTALAAQATQYLNLYRDERFAQALYEIYTRYLEQVTVEELSARNNLELVEPAYVDPARQYNLLPLGLLTLLVLVAVGSEFYMVRPPVGARLSGARSGT